MKLLGWLLVPPLCWPNMLLGLVAAAAPPKKLNVGGLAAAAPKLKPELLGPEGAVELAEPPPPPPPKEKTPPVPPCWGACPPPNAGAGLLVWLPKADLAELPKPTKLMEIKDFIS